MKITLRYRVLGEEDDEVVSLTPEDYFDPLDADETYLEHGIAAKFFDHEHIDVQPGKLKYLILTIAEAELTMIVRTQYLDGEDVLLQHFKGFDGSERLIISKSEDGDWIHIVRLEKPPNLDWTMTSNELASDVPKDGRFESQNLIKNWSYDELLGFAEM